MASSIDPYRDVNIEWAYWHGEELGKADIKKVPHDFLGWSAAERDAYHRGWNCGQKVRELISIGP